MPITTDLNISPYFDDYDETKNYHRILFRPSTPVQARELTQLQTIMQMQIERFGNWAFKNGDVVSGCTPYDMPRVPYVRLANFASNSSTNNVSFNPNDYIGNRIVDPTSNLEAIIMYANSGFITNYPDTNILYLRYLNTGTDGTTVFANTRMLRIKKVAAAGNTWLANIYTYSNVATGKYTTGNGHGISFTEGVIFINGNFVRVSNSTFGVVNAHYEDAGNNVVGFVLDEQIISENDDETLLDNALGYPNENAPGSHRLKLIPVVMAMSEEDAANTKNFNPIGRYNYGSFVSKAVQGSNLYSIVGDVVAKRTYEESGNYVVNPFSVDTVTSTGDTNVAPQDQDHMLARVSPGIGYSQGQRVELLKTAYINMRRGTTTKTYNSQLITFTYGGYFVLNEVAGSFDFTQAETVDLYNATQTAITQREFASLNPTGTKIGTAKVRCFSYNSGNPGTAQARYILHIFDVSMEPTYSTKDIKSVYYVNGTRKATGDVVSSQFTNKEQLYSFGYGGIRDLKDDEGDRNTLYDFRTTKLNCDILSTGDVTVVITDGNQILPYGITPPGTYLPDNEAANFTVVFAANTESAAFTGQSVSISSTANSLYGTGTTTNFVDDFRIGDQIKVGSDIRTITVINSSNNAQVDAPFSTTASGQSFVKYFAKGKIIPIASPSSFVEISLANTFTIHTGEDLAAASKVDVYYNVRKINAVPAKKEIKKNRFVRINTANNPGGPKGPWCLGFSDVHKITAVYASTTSSVNTSSTNVTNNFVFDTGQLDTHYGLAYLYPKNGYDATNTSILVQLDYFNANLQPGVGFFTVESYPIDDANTANTNAIQTKDIPIYITESGRRAPLRDVIDFRIPANNTAYDTGDIDVANTEQVNTAVTAANSNINPSSTLTFKIDVTKGLHTPAYGQNFESDYTRYLPRKDLLMITPDNILKVKEGSSQDAPQTPQLPENAMALAILNIPPFPSLTTDQVDEFQKYNKSSKNIIRDTSASISSNMITNRRYTMKDIGKLDKRITNLEYYTQLSMLEKAAKDLTVTDGNGLDRFKNGIFVDPFSSPTLGDVSNPEYSIAIDQSKGVARPKIVREVFRMNFNSGASTNVKQTGRFITLDYTERMFLSQPYATKYRSSALVAFAWNGKCTLIPAYDNHMDDVNTGSINITIDNSIPWKEFAQSPMSLNWGDWRTNTDLISETVTEGSVENIEFRARRMFTSNLYSRVELERILAAVEEQAAAAGIDPNLVRGNLTIQYGGRDFTSI